MDEVIKLLPCPFCDGGVRSTDAKRHLVWLAHRDPKRCSVFNDGVWTTVEAWNARIMAEAV